MCVFKAASVLAEKDEALFLEPILPIPQLVDVDPVKARLGERLFFDTRLSANNNLSCASCHRLEAGGDDNVAVNSILQNSQYAVNTPTVFNAFFNFRQYWDGSAATLQQQIDMAVKNRYKFNNTWDQIITKLARDEQFRSNFNAAYADGLTKENIIDAIVEFEKTLITPNSRFDRYLRKEGESLTNNEIKGYTLFNELGCVSCHQGTNIGGNLYQRFGLFYNYLAERGHITKQDYGRYNTSNRDMDKFVFKVPTLRNIAVTAPYLHDGSAETIEQAIRIMGKTQLGRVLTDDDIELIKSFLNTLTGEYKNRPLDLQS